MPGPTLATSIAMIPARPAVSARPRGSARSTFGSKDGRVFALLVEGKGPHELKMGPGVACNPLKRLISDERIQGIPNKSNRPKPGDSRSPDAPPRRPEEIQISRRREPGKSARPSRGDRSGLLPLWAPKGPALIEPKVDRRQTRRRLKKAGHTGNWGSRHREVRSGIGIRLRPHSLFCKKLSSQYDFIQSCVN